MSHPADPVVTSERRARWEGVVTGLVGAAVVALFYFIIDIVRGHPLLTPSVLGEAFVLHVPLTTTVNLVAVVLYSVAHIIVFIAMGLLFTLLMRAAETSVLARYAVVQLAVVFELFFYGLLSIGANAARGMFPFLGVLAANTLALIAMAAWEWRYHPALRGAFSREPLGSVDHSTPGHVTSAHRS
jgi:hypothetical protein